jgi:mRNA interferase YafQ
MTSIKTPAQKRTNPPLRSERTKSFDKDWTRLTHSGRYDMNALKFCMLLIIADDGLPAEYKNHQLKGAWADHWECHIGGDFLLIYQLYKDTVVFTRAGTHAELFE